MVWTVLALVLWVVLGGFISYYGDLQGRRWGKRRVSWFGLRPKHTAVLITSLTGGFIALFSVVSLMIIVPTVRDVVTHGENAIQENKRLIADEKQQQLAYELARERSDRENSMKLQAVDKKYADGQRDVANLQKQRTDLESRITPLLARVNALNTKVSALQLNEGKLAANIKAQREQISREDVINRQLAAQNLDYSKTHKALLTSNKALSKQNADLSHIGLRFKELNAQWIQSYSDKEALNAELEKTNNSLKSDKEALQKQIANLNHDRDEVLDLIRQRDRLNDELTQLGSKIAQNYSVLRQGYVTLRAGVELGRISMDAHLRPAAIKSQVNKLIAAASDQAKRFGATAGDNGLAAMMAPQKRVTLTGYERQDENAQISSLADEWSGSDTSVVVVATTVSNCLAGEPAEIDLRRYPVVRVFSKGDEVASRTIDGNSKVEAIIENLMSFLQKDVQKSALQAGIVPRVDPETGQSEVGVLGTADLFQLTDTVRKMRGPLVLTARAKQDVSSADSLDLTFRVTRLGSPTQSVATDY